jgi:hypothetical protein
MRDDEAERHPATSLSLSTTAELLYWMVPQGLCLPWKQHAKEVTWGVNFAVPVYFSGAKHRLFELNRLAKGSDMRTSKMTDAQFGEFLKSHPVSGAYSDGMVGGTGGGSGVTDLITALAGNAAGAYNTTVVANANPLNAALITGGNVTTAQGSVGASTLASSSSTWLLLLGAVVVIFFAMRG